MWMLNFLRLALALSGYAYGESCLPAERQAVAPNAPCPQPVPDHRYSIAVRQTGDAGATFSWPRVELGGGEICTSMAKFEEKNGRHRIWAQCLGVREGKKGHVIVVLRLSCKSKDGKVCKYATEASVPVGKETTVTLGGDTPEPLCASVTLSRVEMANAAPAIPGPGCMPAPMPVGQPALGGCVVGMPMPAPALQVFPQPCMPPPMPVQPPMPAPWQVAMPHPAPVPPMCFVPVAHEAPVQVKSVRLVREDGKSKIEMRGPAGSSKAVKMTVEDRSCGKIHLSAGTRHVHLKGHDWTAQADRVVMGDGCVTLLGHVKMTCEKLGDGVSVTGDKMAFRVKGGHFVELLTK